MDLDFILRANPDYVDDLYRQYRRDPGSVGADWAHFFAGFELGTNGRPAAPTAARQAEPVVGVFDLIHSYRELGHLIADLDPLGGNLTEHPLLATGGVRLRAKTTSTASSQCPTLPRPAAGDAARADRAPARHLLRHARRRVHVHLRQGAARLAARSTWSRRSTSPALERRGSRARLRASSAAATGFEEFLQTKYVGQKRFSLEGAEALIPLLDTLIEDAGERRRRGDRHGHAAPRPPERARQHPAQAVRDDPRRVRGHLPARATSRATAT